MTGETDVTETERRYGAYTMPKDYQADADTLALLDAEPIEAADTAEGVVELDGTEGDD